MIGSDIFEIRNIVVMLKNIKQCYYTIKYLHGLQLTRNVYIYSPFTE